MAYDPYESLGVPKPVTDVPKTAYDPYESLGLRNTGTLGDIGTSFKRGILGLPGVVTGIADIAPALVLGMRPFTKAAEAVGEFTGFQPGKWAEEAKGQYSRGYQEAQQNIQGVWDDPNAGALDVASVYARNPSAVVNPIAESVPGMIAGGLAGRALMTAGRAANAGVGALEARLGQETAAAVAGGVGEGLVQTGSLMDTSTGEDQRKNALAALGSGVIDAVIGFGAGKLAQKVGLETSETAIAKGFNKAVTDELTKASKAGKIAGGALSEGLLQELPQSAQEQVAQNWAEDKPLWDGVARSAVEGALAGFVMGGAVNALPSRIPKESDPVTDKIIKTTTENLTGGTVEKTDEGIKVTTADGAEIVGDPETIATRLADKGTLEPTDDELKQALKLGGQDGQMREGRQAPLDEQSTPDASTQSAPTGVTSQPVAESPPLWQTPLSEVMRMKRDNLTNRQEHFQAVLAALNEGQTVPEEVLKDYPALQRRVNQAALAANAGKGIPVTAEISALAQQAELTPTQQRAETQAAYNQLFGEMEETPVVDRAAVQERRQRVARMVELEAKAQGAQPLTAVSEAGQQQITQGAQPQGLTQTEEQEYQTLRAQMSPADQAALQRHTEGTARLAALEAKVNGAPAFETIGEGGTTTVVPESPPQQLTPAEQAEYSQLKAEIKGPAFNPYSSDSSGLLFSQQRMPWEPEGPVQPKEVVDQIVAQADPTVTYTGVMPGTDLHQFVTTLPNGREANFPVKGEVTPERIAEEKAKAEAKFDILNALSTDETLAPLREFFGPQGQTKTLNELVSLVKQSGLEQEVKAQMEKVTPVQSMAAGATKVGRNTFVNIVRSAVEARQPGVASVEAELKGFLGRGYDNLVRKGLLEVVQSVAALPNRIGNYLNMVAWHGTPHEVDKFRSEKIGTGEGAQAYGYGLYFASAKKVAEWYRDKLSTISSEDMGIQIYLRFPELYNDVLAKLEESGGWISKPITDMGLIAQSIYSNDSNGVRSALGDDLYKRYVEAVRSIEQQGRLYQVELAPQEDEYLLWDKPLSEQSEKVLRLLGLNIPAEVKEYERLRSKKYPEGRKVSKDWTTEDQQMLEKLYPFYLENRNGRDGRTFYEDITKEQSSKEAASEYLHSLGIRGIKYLDGSSRSKGDGAFNYVIFNEDDVTITAVYSKNGSIAGAYDKSTGKIYLVAESIKAGDAKYVMIHEGGHSLLRNDPQFVKQRDKILEDFSKLKSDAVKVAMAKVPADTDPAVRTEEALMYFLQEKANHNHSIFKRIISAVKSALFRLGIPVGRLTESDLVTLFVGGVQRMAVAEQQDKVDASPEVLYSRATDAVKQSVNTITQTAKLLANPKTTFDQTTLQHAPKWLSLMPLHTLNQTFGKSNPYVKQFVYHMRRVGAVYNEIVDKGFELYTEVTDLAKKGVGIDAVNKAAGTASFSRMTPWLKFTEQEWYTNAPGKNQEEKIASANKAWNDSGMKKATGLTLYKAYQQAAADYNALKSDELKKAYQAVVAHAKELRTRERNNLLAHIESVSEAGSELRQNLMSRFEATFNNIYGAYLPLFRQGDFTLEYTDLNGSKVKPQFKSLSEMQEYMAKLEADGVDPESFKMSFLDKQPKGAIALPMMLNDQLIGAVREKMMAGVDPNNAEDMAAAESKINDTVNSMNQIWLRWQPETSALKNSMRRGNVKGYDDNMMLGYLKYVQTHAANISWTEQGRKIEDVLAGYSQKVTGDRNKEGQTNTMLDRMIINDLRERVQAAKTVKVGAFWSTLGKIATGMYMTSPSIALVQMSQLGTLTLPKLVAKTGSWGKASAALKDGLVKSFKSDYSRDAIFSDDKVNEVSAALRAKVTDENREQYPGKDIGADIYSAEEKAAKIGTLNAYQKELLILQEATARGLLDISAVHEAHAIADNRNPDSLTHKVYKYAMMPMALSELASRKAAILASAKLSTKSDFYDIIDDVAEVVDDTLYSYDKINKPVVMQSGGARVIMAFQWYRIMTGIRMVQLFANSIKNEDPKVQAAARKEFAAVLGMTGALAGVTGLPAAGLVFALANLIGGDDDEPYDSKLAFENFAKNHLGDTMGEALLRGLPLLVGTDLSKRIGMGDMYGMQNDPPTTAHGKELAMWHMANLLGPVASIGQSWFQAYDEITRKGEYLKGLEAALPKPLKDLTRTIRIANEGLKDGSGKKLMDDAQIGVDELLMLAIGFNPDEIANAQRANYALNKMSAEVSERRGKLIRDAAKGILAGDPTDSYEAIKSFNTRMPRFGISGGDIRTAVKKRMMGEMGVTGQRERQVAAQFEVPVYSE